MIENLIDMLKLCDHFGISENIEIAKGKYKLTTDFKQIYKQKKRELKFKKLKK